MGLSADDPQGEHHERERVVFLGSWALQILKPFLEGIRPEEFAFSPVRSEAARLAGLRRQEKGARQEDRRALRDHYGVASYRRAIRRRA